MGKIAALGVLGVRFPGRLKHFNYNIMEATYNVDFGIGCCVHTERVAADCAEEALERATASIMAKGLSALYLDYDEAEELAKRDECSIEDLEDMGVLLYVDATMEGAPYPVYLDSAYLAIHKC